MVEFLQVGIVSVTAGSEAAGPLAGKLDHQEHFNHQQHGVKSHEACQRAIEVIDAEGRYAHVGGQHAVDGPGLTAIFSDEPAQLAGQPGRRQSAQRSNQRRRVQTDFKVLQKASPNSRSMAKPSATMSRNAQNIGVTCGTVSFIALSMMAGVAWFTSSTYFFSSRPKPRSALYSSKVSNAALSVRSARRASSALTAVMPRRMRARFFALMS